MLERLNEQAVRAIMLAEEEARRFGQNLIGTEQMLFGLFAEETGIAARALKSFGLKRKLVRASVLGVSGIGSGLVPRNIPYTPRAQEALRLAAGEALNLHSDKIGPEHILLGLLREGDGFAVRLLRSFGVEPHALSERVIQIINSSDFKHASDFSDPYSLCEEDPPPSTVQEALQMLYELYSFIKADSVPSEMLGWLDDKDSLFGVYFNAQDDNLLICNQGIYWLSGETKTYIDFKSIDSLELPEEDEDPYLKIVLRPRDSLVMLPVLHSTEDYADVFNLYEFISFFAKPRFTKMDIQDIQSREDLILFLRQPNVKTEGYAELASWLERGDPKPSWLESLNIAPEVLQDPSVWRLIALILLRCLSA
jgi:hypothetical protein